VSIVVIGVNDAPVAVGDSYSTEEGTALTVSAPGVLSNDTDPDGDTLTASLVSGPGHGTLTLNGNGSFTYNPASDYSGSDSFSYQACDPGLLCGGATVSIQVTEVTGVNQRSVQAGESYGTDENTTLAVPPEKTIDSGLAGLKNPLDPSRHCYDWPMSDAGAGECPANAGRGDPCLLDLRCLLAPSSPSPPVGRQVESVVE
jgi:VCBS repeat-containing protein